MIRAIRDIRVKELATCASSFNVLHTPPSPSMDQVVGQCGTGFCILVGVKNGDTQAEAKWLANKVANLRVFEDDAGKMNLSLLDVKGEALVVSQFTLYANAQRGRRPDFIDAARPEQAEPLIDYFVEQLRAEGVPTQTGCLPRDDAGGNSQRRAGDDFAGEEKER